MADQEEQPQGIRRLPQYADGPPRRGVSDLVALVLITLNLDTVRRSTVRSLLPRGEQRTTGRGNRINAISEQFAGALRRFEKNGWVQREDVYVHVKDRQALIEHIAMGVDVNEERGLALLAVEEAARQLNADLESGVVIPGWTAEQVRRDTEIRRQELNAIKRLMESGPGSHPGGSGTVRIIPRGKSL